MIELPPGIDPTRRYRTYATYLREEFGEPLPRICIDPATSCPNRDGTVGIGGCAFCSPAAFSGGTASASPADQVIVGRERLAVRGKHRFLVYLQTGTTTHAPIERLREWYEQILGIPGVAGLIVGTRPDALPDPTVDLLGEVSRRRPLWVELGLQSADPDSLRAMDRGHGPEAFSDAVVRLRRHPGIRVGAHLIAGLPGEGSSQMNATAEFLSALGIDGVKIHPFHVVAGTRWGREHAGRPFLFPTLEESATAVAGMLERLPAATVVLRVGASCPPALLIGPAWVNKKGELASAVGRELSLRESFQGALAPG